MKGNGNGIGNGEKYENQNSKPRNEPGTRVDSNQLASVFSVNEREGTREIIENLVWMTSAEAAKYLRKSYGALRVMVCRGYVKPRIFRRRWYFKRSELDQLIENSI